MDDRETAERVWTHMSDMARKVFLKDLRGEARLVRQGQFWGSKSDEDLAVKDFSELPPDLVEDIAASVRGEELSAREYANSNLGASYF